MNYAPIARIILRYLIGGVVFGSAALGEELSANSDVVTVVALLLGFAVEALYIVAKRKGWAT
jgi:hypothetical protein